MLENESKMVNLTKEELQHLEKLANVSIDSDQEDKFLSKLDSVVDKLNDLNMVDTSNVMDVQDPSNTLRVIWWTRDFENKKWIIDNVKHDVVNNSIVIKSALSE